MPNVDARMVAGALAGEPGAADDLFAAYWPLVWRVAVAVTGSRSAAEDVAQDAFLKAFRSLHRFDTARPFAPWISQITVRCGLDAARRRTPAVSIEAVPEEGRSDPLDEHGDVRGAVAGLPTDRRVAVALHYWAGMSVSEIAELLGVPHGTAASRLQRGVEQLRARFQEEEATR